VNPICLRALEGRLERRIALLDVAGMFSVTTMASSTTKAGRDREPPSAA